jgi:hypothetical protein
MVTRIRTITKEELGRLIDNKKNNKNKEDNK